MAESNLRVNITGDSSKLNSALTSASGKLQSFGSKMQSVGSSLSTRLTLPLVAAGAASVKMAFDFNKSMTQIESLVGVGAKSVKEMGETAKKMAIDTGKSANEAAEALFFITSAGLRGSQATDTLNASLKASAVGLGETKVIADLATSAMNGYADENLTATQATDILVAAVREGKLEASELAGAMGGVIPIASNMGVGFNEVGAAMAAMSRTGTNAAEGATQLNAILMSFKKPTEQSAQAMEDLGTSQEELTQSLADKGLMPTLLDLSERLEAAGMDATAIFPNIRALKGVMDLTGSGAADNVKIFDALNNTMGATDEAFQKTSQSASFKMTKGLNSMKSSLMEVGQVILTAVAPMVEKLGNFFTSLSEKFKALSPTTQKIIVAFVGIVAALGPVIAIIGTLLTMAPAIGAAFTLMMGPVGLIIAGLTAIAFVIYKNWSGIKTKLIEIANYFIELYNNSLPVKIAVEAIIMQFKNFLAVGKFVFKSVISVFKAFGNAALGYLGGVGDILMGILTFDLEKIKQGFSGIGDAMKGGFTDAIDGIKENAAELGTSVVDNFNDALNAGKIDKIKVEAESDLSGINFDDLNGSMSKDELKNQVDKRLKDGPDAPDAPKAPDAPDAPKAPPIIQPIKPVIDPEAAEKLKALNEKINSALITNDTEAYKKRRDDAIAHYDALINNEKTTADQRIALEKAKEAKLAEIDNTETERLKQKGVDKLNEERNQQQQLLDAKQQIADATNASEDEQKALEIERIRAKYAELRQLAIDNNLMTIEQQAAFDAAQAEAEALVYEEKKTRFLGFMMSQQEAAEQMQAIGEAVDGSFGAIGNSIVKMFGGAESATGAFVGTLAKDALKVIASNLKIALSGASTAATETSKSFGPAAAFVLPALLAGATALISGTFSKFADGGIVSGPTMGLVGEYPGARSNPEVIAPLNKLQGMIGSRNNASNVNVTGSVSVSGQDLLIAIERANETADRIY